MLVQVPPSAGLPSGVFQSSMQTVFSPSCAARRGDVTARPAADHDNVKGLGHSGFKDRAANRAGSSSASLIATSDSTASRPSTMRWS